MSTPALSTLTSCTQRSDPFAVSEAGRNSLTIMGRAEPPRMMKGRLAPDRSLTPTLSQRAREPPCCADFIVSAPRRDGPALTPKKSPASILPAVSRARRRGRMGSASGRASQPAPIRKRFRPSRALSAHTGGARIDSGCGCAGRVPSTGIWGAGIMTTLSPATATMPTLTVPAQGCLVDTAWLGRALDLHRTAQ